MAPQRDLKGQRAKKGKVDGGNTIQKIRISAFVHISDHTYLYFVVFSTRQEHILP